MRLNVDKRGLPVIENIKLIKRVISAEKAVPAIRITSIIKAVSVIRVNIKLFNTVPAVISAIEVSLKSLNIIITTVTTRAMRKKETANEKN